jgi:hypothetical protein
MTSGDESSRSLHIEASQLRSSSIEGHTPHLPLLKTRCIPELKPEYDKSKRKTEKNTSQLDKLLRRLRHQLANIPKGQEVEFAGKATEFDADQHSIFLQM